jgi:hypothetical protein
MIEDSLNSVELLVLFSSQFWRIARFFNASIVSNFSFILRLNCVEFPVFPHPNCPERLLRIVPLEPVRDSAVSSPEISSNGFGVSLLLIEGSYVLVFCIWHETTTPRYALKLFSIIDGRGNQLQICLHADHLNIVQSMDIYETAAQLHIRIPCKQWSFVSILFENVPDKTRVFARSPRQDPDDGRLPKMARSKDSIFVCKIGGI